MGPMMKVTDIKKLAEMYAQIVQERKCSKMNEMDDADTDGGDEGGNLDPVNKKAVKKKFADRKDKDIDNDGDVDSTDKYLHKRRKAISKAIDKEDKPVTEAQGTVKSVGDEPMPKKGEKSYNPPKSSTASMGDPKTGTKASMDEALGKDSVKLAPVKGSRGTKFKVMDLAKNLQGNMDKGEVIGDTEIDDLQDMGIKVMIDKKEVREGAELTAEDQAKLAEVMAQFDEATKKDQTKGATEPESQDDVNKGDHGGGDVRGDRKGVELFTKSGKESDKDIENNREDGVKKTTKAEKGAPSAAGNVAAKGANKGDQKVVK